MHELPPGVWHGQSAHPEWNEEEGWPELVSSYAIELGDDVVLFDPLAVPDELRGRATAVVLTAPYHERDARDWASRCIHHLRTPGRTGSRSSASTPNACAAWRAMTLPGRAPGEGEGHFHDPGAWPFGMTAYAGRENNDRIHWLPSIRAIVTGDHSPTSATAWTSSSAVART